MHDIASKPNIDVFLGYFFPKKSFILVLDAIKQPPENKLFKFHFSQSFSSVCHIKEMESTLANTARRSPPWYMGKNGPRYDTF